jgi:DNA-binding PadR family transcriptional regulator
VKGTYAAIQVAQVLMAKPDAKHYCLAVSRQSGISYGTTIKILKRMLDEGLLAEAGEGQVGHRRLRQYYKVTNSGRVALAEAIEAAQEGLRPRLRRRPTVDL